MSFAERNEAWNGAPYREFHQLQSRSGVPRIWGIRVDENRIHTRWGQLGGAMQNATEVMNGVNIGKKNEKSPEIYAVERAREMARKKDWEGYREVNLIQPYGEVTYFEAPTKSEINFDDLPLNLCFYKPDNIMGAGITKKAEAGNVWYSRKRNGLAFVIARGKDHPRLYTRKMLRQDENEFGSSLTWNDRFPHIIEAATAVMPQDSILLGELVHNRDGNDDFKYVQSIFQLSTLGAQQRQKEEGYLSFYIWDIAFWEGRDMVKEAPVSARYELIHDLEYQKAGVGDARVYPLIPVQYFTSTFFKTPEIATKHAITEGWEGFVVVDPEGIYGDRAYNFKGKPDRPGAVCAKLKPTYEDDFVAYWDPAKGWGEQSTKSRNNQGIKCVALFQYNKAGQLVEISNVSSGLSDEQKKNWAVTDRWPKCWRVEYKDRRYVADGEDTNALDFAAFVEERSDKKPEECINPRL